MIMFFLKIFIMNKIFSIAVFFFLGTSFAYASQVSSGRDVVLSNSVSSDYKDNKPPKMERDTIATTMKTWQSQMKELLKDGWFFKALIYESGNVSLIVERPVKEGVSPNSNRGGAEGGLGRYVYRFNPTVQKDYIEDAYFESLMGRIHIVNNKIVEWISTE